MTLMQEKTDFVVVAKNGAKTASNTNQIPEFVFAIFEIEAKSKFTIPSFSV